MGQLVQPEQDGDRRRGGRLLLHIGLAEPDLRRLGDRRSVEAVRAVPRAVSLLGRQQELAEPVSRLEPGRMLDAPAPLQGVGDELGLVFFGDAAKISPLQLAERVDDGAEMITERSYQLMQARGILGVGQRQEQAGPPAAPAVPVHVIGGRDECRRIVVRPLSVEVNDPERLPARLGSSATVRPPCGG